MFSTADEERVHVAIEAYWTQNAIFAPSPVGRRSAGVDVVVKSKKSSAKDDEVSRIGFK